MAGYRTRLGDYKSQGGFRELGNQPQLGWLQEQFDKATASV